MCHFVSKTARREHVLNIFLVRSMRVLDTDGLP